ncbi:MAG: cation:proton antiporter [Gemmatimonadaceae bacterium]
MTTETTLVALFSLATAVAIATRRLHVPYTVALVLAGLAVGVLHVIAPPHLTKELLFAVFLPGLLFEAAFNIDTREFMASKIAISLLAVPGVLIAVLLTGATTSIAFHLLDGSTRMTLQYSLVFGALVAATDPIAVVAMFKSLHVPSRLATLIEGESLFNDGTSVVFLGLLLSYVAGATSSVASLAVTFLIVAGGGVIAGLIVGVVASRTIRRINDPMIEITVSVIAAYGAFSLAEQFHVSGVIATVVAGMYTGFNLKRGGMEPATHVAAAAFWEYLAFALNSVVFLLIGFEIKISSLRAAWVQIVIAYVAVMLVRAIVMAGTHAAVGRTAERLPRGWATVLTWGGLRGALSMVLALALPFTFPNRNMLITLTFGVVLLSILVQGLSMAWVLRSLGIVSDS